MGCNINLITPTQHADWIQNCVIICLNTGMRRDYIMVHKIAILLLMVQLSPTYYITYSYQYFG